jgi:hypothetical protein
MHGARDLVPALPAITDWRALPISQSHEQASPETLWVAVAWCYNLSAAAAQLPAPCAVMTALRSGLARAPQVGISSVWWEGNPCNMHLNDLAAEVKAGVEEAGLVGLRFNTIGVSDGISMGTSGMSFSLQSRDLIAGGRHAAEGQPGRGLLLLLLGISEPGRSRCPKSEARAAPACPHTPSPALTPSRPADSIETVMSAQWYDANISLPGCDKNMPGTLMAMARLNRPSLMIYGGAPQAAPHAGQQNQGVKLTGCSVKVALAMGDWSQDKQQAGCVPPTASRPAHPACRRHHQARPKRPWRRHAGHRVRLPVVWRLRRGPHLRGAALRHCAQLVPRPR